MGSLPFDAYYRLMRLDKPVGIWLLMWPCWWSVTLAAKALEPGLLILFLLGSVLMRSAGCIVNDIADRRIDAQVERTKNRPIASGEVSVGEGVVLIFFLLILSLVVALMLGLEVVKFSFLWLPLVLLYPLMKRITWWPQLFLGLTFNAGALFGWVAVTGAVAPTAELLYLGGIFWTLGYDTIYACQDKEDDARVGVKSTALRFGNNIFFWVAGFYLLFVFLLALAGKMASLSPLYYALLLVPAAHLARQLWALRGEAEPEYRKIFLSNQWAGALIFLIIVVSVSV